MYSEVSNQLNEKIPRRQLYKGKEYFFEEDSSPLAWKFYELYFFQDKARNKEEIIIKEINNKEIRRISKSIEYSNEQFIEVAGDVSFNFNEKKEGKFNELIGNNSDLKKLLRQCIKMNYSLLNVDPVPVTGGINNLKGHLKIKDNKIMVHDSGRRPTYMLDRFDTFISFLDSSLKFMNDNKKSINLRKLGIFFSESIFTTSFKTENFVHIYDFLSRYDNIQDYCKDFYPFLINQDDFLNALIINGSKDIASNSIFLQNYMELALQYWKIKNEYFQTLEKK